MVGLRTNHTRLLAYLALSLSTLWSTVHAFVAPKPALTIRSSKRTDLNGIYTPRQPRNNADNKEHAHFVLQDFAMCNGEIIDPYETLHVDRKDNSATIKQAYRTLCRSCHPDAIRQYRPELDDKLVREQWERITWSYKLLSDDRQRCKYNIHYAVAYPGQSVLRAASTLALMGYAALSKGLVGMGHLARAQVCAYEQTQYPQVLQQPHLGDAILDNNDHDWMDEQPAFPQNFLQARLTALAQGFSRLGKMLVAKLWRHHVVRRQGQQQQYDQDPIMIATTSPLSPQFVLEGARRPIGCHPFPVAMLDDFANMINSIKKFL